MKPISLTFIVLVIAVANVYAVDFPHTFQEVSGLYKQAVASRSSAAGAHGAEVDPSVPTVEQILQTLYEAFSKSNKVNVSRTSECASFQGNGFSDVPTYYCWMKKYAVPISITKEDDIKDKKGVFVCPILKTTCDNRDAQPAAFLYDKKCSDSKCSEIIAKCCMKKFIKLN